MREPMKSQHCPVLTKEQRQVLDAAARRYGTDWYVGLGRRGRHYKVYLGDRMIAVLSLSRGHNAREPVKPEKRLHLMIERAMREKQP